MIVHDSFNCSIFGPPAPIRYHALFTCNNTFVSLSYIPYGGRRGRDRMVVGFTTTYAISAYHHWWCEFESRTERGVQHNASQWFATGWWFSPGPPVSSSNQTDRHYINEILLKVALNTINQKIQPIRPFHPTRCLNCLIFCKADRFSSLMHSRHWLSCFKWVSDCCLTQIHQFFATSWREQVNFQWGDDEVRFVLDQHPELDFYSTSSLKQQSVGRNVAPLEHIILIPSQPVFHSFSLIL